MNTPFVFGGPQVLLLVIAIVGVGLLVSSFMGLRGGRREHEKGYWDEQGRFHQYRHHHRHRRHFKWGRSLSGVLLLVLALSLLWVTFLVQTYLGLTSDIQVAQVRATQITGIPHMMSVELILYDQNGHQASDKTYLVQGDEWMLQGDIIKFPTWLNIVGLHTGYKLTRLEGRFDDPNLERNSQHTVIELNGGDDNFFKTVQQQAWLSPTIEAAYGNAVFLGADSRTYNVYVSQTGLLAKPAR
ncbi:MAG TPA: hypothetical protein VFU49_09255 [Ktedonobacteraceae bacterium]|nr:hypothetical protein [Ktedonobacteraceae bacterium]